MVIILIFKKSKIFALHNAHFIYLFQICFFFKDSKLVIKCVSTLPPTHVKRLFDLIPGLEDFTILKVGKATSSFDIKSEGMFQIRDFRIILSLSYMVSICSFLSCDVREWKHGPVCHAEA
jgi:hypothetical protein